jgi:hypothetical protein
MAIVKYEIGKIYKFENAWGRFIIRAEGPSSSSVLADHWDFYIYVGHDFTFFPGDIAPLGLDQMKFCEDWTPAVDQIWSDGDDEYVVAGVDLKKEVVQLVLGNDFSSYYFCELFSEFKLVGGEVSKNGYTQGYLEGHSGLKWL